MYASAANQVIQDQQHRQHINKNTQLQPGIYYRRVSERQQLRNSSRIQAHKDSTNARRTANNEIESLRCNEITSDDFNETHGSLDVDHCEPDHEIGSPSVNFSSSPGTPPAVPGASVDLTPATVVVPPVTLLSPLLLLGKAVLLGRMSY